VTFQMNYLRQKGLLRYSRKGIQVYTDALLEYLEAQNKQQAPWPQPGKGTGPESSRNAILTSGGVG
jgi:hypothetical protein